MTWISSDAIRIEAKAVNEIQEDKFIIIIHSSRRNYKKERASDFWFPNRFFRKIVLPAWEVLQILFIEFALFAVQRRRT